MPISKDSKRDARTRRPRRYTRLDSTSAKHRLTTPPIHYAEGLTVLYLLGACENFNFQSQFLEITEVVGPITPALLLIHIELSVLQDSCRKHRED